jgi:hypothetical protein
MHPKHYAQGCINHKSLVHRWGYEPENPLIRLWGPDGGGGEVRSRRGRSEGAELEGESKRGGGVEGLKPMCEDDGGCVGSAVRKLFCAPPTPSPPPPHPELIINQQLSVRCLKGRSGS